MTWETVPLRELARVDAKTVQPDLIPNDFPYVGLESIGRAGAIDESIEAGASGLKSAKNSYDARHVLFGKLRPNLGKVARPRKSGVCSTDIYPILPSDRIGRDYLAHYLLSPEAIAYSVGRSSGVSLPRVSWSALGELQVPLPPRAEQRRIAAILDEADALRSLTAHRLASLTSLTRARHHYVLASGAPTGVLADVLDRIESGDSPVCEARPATADEWGVLKLGAITSGEYLPRENKAITTDYLPKPHLAVAAGDLLFSRKNTLEHVGASVYVDETPPKRLLPDLVFRLVPRNPQIGRALHAYLSLPSTRRALSNLAGGSASSMANISKARLLNLPIPSFAPTAVSEIDALSVATRSARERGIAQWSRADTLFASLQHRAFRGEL